MSRKTREKERKAQETRALMDPQQRERMDQKERERREKLEQQRSQRREQQETALNERLKKKRRRQMKKILIGACIAIGVIGLIVALVILLRPVTTVFSYSDWIDGNGFWKGIKALDYVDRLDYRGMEIPPDVHRISEDEVQHEIDHILADYKLPYHITDRPVMDGDEVNIDYTGSVDGVEFENGSTGGAGTDVTIGVTSYIDDFLEQLIGRMPGETFDVEVTFPEDYPNNPDLENKDAVFVTTINYITEDVPPELTDDFVAENLSDEYGWQTAAEAREQTREELQRNAIQRYALERLSEEANVQTIPDRLVEFQKQSILASYQGYADTYGMELEDFLSMYSGYDNADDFLVSQQEAFEENAVNYLVLQAVAEDAGIKVSDEDLTGFFLEQTGNGDYSLFEDQYVAYAKQLLLNQKAIDFIIENAVLT